MREVKWSRWEHHWCFFDLGISAGVFWTVWAKVGFWKAVLYGLFWELWLCWRLGEWLVLHFWR
jgi:hypothetical protein